MLRGVSCLRGVVKQPVMGEDLTLSISLPLQEVATRALEGQVGSVVLMDADSGELLAQVSLPSYDPNEFVMGISHAKWNALLEDPNHPLQNRPVQSAYPPGVGIQTGGRRVGPGERCGGRRPPRCTAREATSSGRRVFPVLEQRRARKDEFQEVPARILRRVLLSARRGSGRRCHQRIRRKNGGFGVRTGSRNCPTSVRATCPLPHGSRGVSGEKWQGGETLNFAIGQGYTQTTPLQVARFVAALVNGGKILRPTLLVSEAPDVIGELPMKDSTRKLVVDAMIATVEEDRGTARILRRDGVRIGAKTGTAQVVKLLDKYEKKKTDEIPYKYRDHAWLAGFAEKDGRRYVAVAMVEHGGHGGSDAGPVVGAVFDAILGSPDAE